LSQASRKFVATRSVIGDHVRVTGPLPSATARGKALQREIAALDIAASCESPDLWAASRDCSPTALLWTKARLLPHPPDVVAWPEDAEQVAALMRLAARLQVPIVPLGGGTGTAGGAVPVRGGIVLDTKRLTRPLRIDVARGTVDVGAGMNGKRLDELLSRERMTLGHAPASLRTATVGGWLATRSAGLLSTRYGAVADMVLSLTAVDGAGEILRTLEGPCAGPDLAQILLGSEGTLAVLTEARLRIWRRPRERWLRAVRFASLGEALGAVRDVLRAGLRPAIVRLHDPLDTVFASADPFRAPQPLRWLAEGAQAEALRVALRAPLLLNRLVDALPASSLIVLAFEGASEDDAAEEGGAALAICRKERGEDLGAAPAERWLAQIHRAPWRQAPLFAAGAFVESLDVATTWERAEPMYRALRRAVEGVALVRAHFDHAAKEGCAIELSLIGLAGAPAAEIAGATRDDAEADFERAQQRLEAAWSAALVAVADEGASISHHSGVGVARQVFLRRELGEGMRQLQALKKAFDPQGILNPGKLLL
jgi:alkyldihydroxyacetonephosphate synthase